MLLVTCPDPHQLQQLVTGQLDELLAAGLEDHLCHCPQCLAVVESLPEVDPLEHDVQGWALHESRHPLEQPSVRY